MARAMYGRLLMRAGAGASYELPFQMLGQTALSVSRSDTAGHGHNWLIGVERSGLRHGVSFSAEGASRGYRQLGIDTASPLPRLQTTASYSYSTDRFGAFNLSYAGFDNYDSGKINTVGLNYTMRVGKRSALTLMATRLSGASSGSFITVSLRVPLDNRITLASGASIRSNTTESYVNASQALSAETGWGWRAETGRHVDGGYAEGGAYYQGTKGLFSADVSTGKTQQNLRLGLSFRPTIRARIDPTACDPNNCAGYILPDRVQFPWSAGAGVAWRFGSTPWNRRVATDFRNRAAH